MEQEKLVPKRRFERFNDEWEERSFDKEIELYSGLTYAPNDVTPDGTFVLRSSNVQNGEIVNADNVYVNSEVVNSKNVEEGDIIVVVRNGSRSLIGKHAKIKIRMDKTVIGAFMTGIRSDQPNFINALLDTQNFKGEIDKNLGATINQITNGMFTSMSFFFPTYKEQQKIGQFFKHLDEMIALQQRKIDKTKALKSAYLAEMFPAEGERVPKRRFAGFTGEWKEKKLEDVADIISGGTPSTNNVKYWNGDIDWYTPTEIGKHVYAKKSLRTITKLGLEKSSAKILPPNKTILFTSRAGIGDMAILKKQGTTNQGFQSIVLKDNIDTYFIYSMGYLIKRYAIKNASGSTFLEISGKPLGNMKLLLPSLNEQQKIGAFFKKLDDTIANHQHKLEKLKATKQAYLHEMFV